MRRRDPLVGRGAELERVAGALAAAEGGAGGLLLVAGEAGVGKTALVEEALAATRMLALRSVAAQHGAMPYAPIVAVLRAYLRHDPRGFSHAGVPIPELAALLPELGRRRRTPD